jgi:hypothetical protein
MKGSKCKERIRAERHAFSLLLLSTIAVGWWVALWGIFEEGVTAIEEKLKWKRYSIYLVFLGLIAFIVFLFPELTNNF